MPRRSPHRYDPDLLPEKFGYGGFSDNYDNDRLRSMDRSNTGGVTHVPLEDDIDLTSDDFTPHRGVIYRNGPGRSEHPRDADLGMGPSGTSWNYNLGRSSGNPHKYFGKGPKGWKISDERLAERVAEVLMHSHDVDPSELEVRVEDRVVYLEGNIQSKGMRRVAEDLVLSIPGVEDVFTRLKIQDTRNFQPGLDQP